MEPSGFIPGIVKVIEDRLGPLGRPFTTFIAVMLGLGIAAWAYGEIAIKWIDPLTSKIFMAGAYRLCTPDMLLSIRLAIFFAVYVVVIAVWMIVRSWFHRRDISELERELEECKQKLDKSEETARDS